MKPIKVLLIDDDEDDFLLTKEIFNELPQKENYILSWINNYEEGINAMLKSHFDIYLVDYRLGKYTGLDLLHEAIKSNVAEPVIILTGKGDAKVDNEALKIGAADYLIKDQIDPLTIERSLRYALKHTQTMKALKESENKFRIIFERSKEAFLILDAKGKIRDINKAGLSFFGYSNVEIVNFDSKDLFQSATDYNFFAQEMDKNGAINNYETTLVTKNKDSRIVNVSAFLQIDQHATEELYYCIIHDISKLKLQTNSKNQTAAIKGVASEITDPLTTINLALAQLTADLETDDEAINLYLDIISSNFKKINTLVSDYKSIK